MKFLTVGEIADILKIGRNTAYNLMTSNGFPSLRVGRQIRVDETAFEQWVENNSGKYSFANKDAK